MGLLLVIPAALSLLWIIPGLALARDPKQSGWSAVFSWRPVAMALCIQTVPFVLNAGGRIGQLEPFFWSLQIALMVGMGSGLACVIKKLRTGSRSRLLLGSLFIAAALAPVLSLLTAGVLAAIFRLELHP